MPEAKAVYVIKTQAITGKLVPFRGEHIEYDSLHKALSEAKLIGEALDLDLVVVDYRTDAIVAFIQEGE